MNQHPPAALIGLVLCLLLTTAAGYPEEVDPSGTGVGDSESVSTPQHAVIHLTDRTMYTYSNRDRFGPSEHDRLAPYELTIQSGSTVEWYVESGRHIIEASDGSFSSETLTPGLSFWYRFDRPGNFAFRNPFHEGNSAKALEGVIHVVPPP